MKKHLIILLFIFCLFNTISAQQALTFYRMDRVLQSQFVNPAAKSPYKIHIGGTLIPVFGQIPPSMYLNYSNNSFHYNHIFHMGSGSKSNDLVLDLPLLMKKARKTTHIRFENNIELINFGIQLEKSFVSIALTEKVKFGVSIPYDFLEFCINGNKPYMLENKTHDMSKLDINATHYRELALGLSQEMSEKLRIGGRVKLLFGKSNVSTKTKSLSGKTHPGNYEMSVITDMEIRSSLPIRFNYERYGTDSVFFEIDENSRDDFDPLDYAFNMRNFGFGFDLGASYQLNDQIELFGSVTDLGVIFWNTNPQIFKTKGEYNFEGIEIIPNDSENKLEGSAEALLDTLKNIFLFDLREDKGYSTWLPTSIYLGGEYRIHDKISVGALYRGEFYRKSYLQSLTLFANSNLNDWFSAHLSYSVAHNSFANLGLGLTARLGFVNWFLVTDNLPALIWPQKGKSFNIRMGCNLVFGYKKTASLSRLKA